MEIFIKEGQGFKSGYRKCTDNKLEEILYRAFGFETPTKGQCGRTSPMDDPNNKVYRVVEVIGYNDNFPGTEVYIEEITPPSIIK